MRSYKVAESVSIDNSFVGALACAALQPGLRCVLVFDASPGDLEWVANVFEAMLKVTENVQSISRKHLSPTDTDDTLWGRPLPADGSDHRSFVWHGVLTKEHAQKHQLITTHNLANTSLAAQRAMTVVPGAEVVHLERHGQSEHWRPLVTWLAACQSKEIGQVSPHLLDRFSLRLRVPRTLNDNTADRVLWLLEQMTADTSAKHSVELPTLVVDKLRLAVQSRPSMTELAIRRVVGYLPVSVGHSSRRDLALGRLAVAQAMLDEAQKVTTAHVDKAAVLMGFDQIEDPKPVEPQVEEQQPAPLIPEPAPLRSLPSVTPSETEGFPREGLVDTPIYESDNLQSLSPRDLPAPAPRPYPEDQAPILREMASLRLPPSQNRQTGRERGVPVGVQPATSLRDLALTATLFEAAKFQAFRSPKAAGVSKELIVRPSDLRSYRRAPTPESMLVLLLDFTALANRQWEDALLPHLMWAYTERASIAIIRVGAADAIHELRADRLLARNLLSSRVDVALTSASGRATPLAHGLDLLFQTLQRALQHGRNALLNARLVVLTDGRGNVPLDVSRTGMVRLPVNREGIEDAIRVALDLQMFDRVDKFFLDPQPPQYAELTQDLAAAMGATIKKIPKMRLDEDQARNPASDSLETP